MNDYFGHRWSHVTIAINYSPPPSSLFLETSKRAKNICCRIKLMHNPHSTDSYEKIHLWRIWSHFYWTMNKRHYENWRDSHIFVVYFIFSMHCSAHFIWIALTGRSMSSPLTHYRVNVSLRRTSPCHESCYTHIYKYIPSDVRWYNVPMAMTIPCSFATLSKFNKPLKRDFHWCQMFGAFNAHPIQMYASLPFAK